MDHPPNQALISKTSNTNKENFWGWLRQNFHSSSSSWDFLFHLPDTQQCIVDRVLQSRPWSRSRSQLNEVGAGFIKRRHLWKTQRSTKSPDIATRNSEVLLSKLIRCKKTLTIFRPNAVFAILVLSSSSRRRRKISYISLKLCTNRMYSWNVFSARGSTEPKPKTKANTRTANVWCIYIYILFTFGIYLQNVV